MGVQLYAAGAIAPGRLPLYVIDFCPEPLETKQQEEKKSEIL